MKTIYNCSIVLCLLLLVAACNNEWDEEQYQQYVSFKAPMTDGVTPIYVRYKAEGKVTYKLPLIVSGSTLNERNLDVHIAVDPDTLNILNEARFTTRTDLYYKQLTEEKYDFPETVQIPADSYVKLMDIDFSLKDIDMVDKWVLPLTIVDNTSYNYQGHPRKNYAKALLKVIPFNDYSGAYSTTTMEVYFRKNDGGIDDMPMVANNRTAYVVDDNTVFFYAGLISEELEQRATYKIFVRFNKEDQTISMWPENEAINFKLYGTPGFSVTEAMDATRPYLLHRYVSFSIEYDFDDITSAPGVRVPYKVKGTMMLERNLNTQIPDEDQAIEW